MNKKMNYNNGIKIPYYPNEGSQEGIKGNKRNNDPMAIVNSAAQTWVHRYLH